jgi:membrane protein CcdC involved in cytochrome C biogenesis
MELIKKIALELWCMAYGALLFLIAWWVVVAVAALIAFIMFVVYVATPKKMSGRVVDRR